MEITGVSYIGSGAAGAGGARNFAVDPANGEKLEPAFAEATPEEIDWACALAAEAAPRLALTPPERRAAFLDAIAAAILEIGPALIERGHRETALPAARLESERGRTVGQLRLFAEVVREGSWVDARIDRADPSRAPLAKPDVRSLLRPLGPIVVFGSSNFPLAFSVAGGDTASALAAGNPVIVKGHPAHPGTSELVARAIVEAAREMGLPDGTFALVQGAGHDVGLRLVRHPAVEAVGFTGSLRAGRALFDAAAARERPIPVFAEMGSQNPVFLLAGALAERGVQIARGLHQSLTLGVGQFCTNPGLVVLAKDASSDAFINELSRLVTETPSGTLLYAGIRQNFDAGVEQAASVAGVETVARGARASGGCASQAALLKTSARAFAEHSRLREEIFGPAALIVLCESPAEFAAVAAVLGGQLTATLHATDSDLERHASLVQSLERKVGRLVVNAFPTGVEVCASMQHGGPYPAASDARFTSVGTRAIFRFARPVCYQGFPDAALPPELRDANPLGIERLIDGVRTRNPIPS
jgi:2,5-dioxopentanoate dehydrogenase